MATVRAKTDLRSPTGKLLIAKAGRFGMALREHAVKEGHYNKVPVRWKGRSKVYWHDLDDLEFIQVECDKLAYVARRPDQLLDLPPIPKPPTHYNYHFGETLRAFREDRKLPQWELANRMMHCGEPVAQTTISYWERSEAAPNGVYVTALAKALDVPVFLFFVNFRDCTWLRKVRQYINQLTDMMCQDVIY